MAPVRRPSAALVLGWMAGALAAISFVPTSVPLIWQIIRMEELLGRTHTTAVALSVQASTRHGVEPSTDLLKQNAIDHLMVRSPEGVVRRFGVDLPAETIDQVCQSSTPSTVLQLRAREIWAISCDTRDGVTVAAAIPLDPRAPAQRVFGMVLLLAVFVGMVTALGVLWLLRPLSEISRGLARVGAGERGVNVGTTGLAELDELADRLNAAARAVDDREDAILSRIEVVQEMARIVAHEIRNPLQSLELLTSLIAHEDDATERILIGQSIHTEVANLEQFVHRLLRESAARGALRLQLTQQSIAPLVQHVLALRRPQANGQGVSLTSGALSWTEFAFDHALIKRSIENLVVNALQAVSRGIGEVVVSVIDEPDAILIVVEDNGPGVPEELRDHVFEPNVTHGKAGGTGIGLTLVKGVIEAHNGYIRCTVSPLGGARFEARLPITFEPSEEQPRRDAP